MALDSSTTIQSATGSTLTPMMRQYLETKEQYPDAILLYRIGDFYEMFYQDAVTAAKVLDIVLTSRNKNDPNPVPLCGVPYHSIEPYIEKLLDKGYKVAICDQVEDPKSAKGVVKREVTRLLTPSMSGFFSNEESQKRRHTLMAFCRKEHKGRELLGVAFLDVATGQFQLGEFEIESEKFKAFIEEELLREMPQEILLTTESYEDLSGLLNQFKDRYPLCVTRFDAWIWEEDYARRILKNQFEVHNLSGFGCEDFSAGIVAAGAALHYARETQKVERLPHVPALKVFDRSQEMILTEDSRKNLGVPELVDLLDQTSTSMGRRTFREWFFRPMKNLQAINARLDAVTELKDRALLVQDIRHKLSQVYDLERICSRLGFGTVNARDLRALANSLQLLAQVKAPLSEFQSESLQNIAKNWDVFEELATALDKTLVEAPPFTLKEGGLIADQIYPELDELRSLRRDSKQSIAAMEEKERKRTGITTLKIQFNRVFGYYLEVTAAHLSKVPADFIRKQTLTNAERFITPELKVFEDKILGAEEKIKALEYEIFCNLRDNALAEVKGLKKLASQVGILDAFLSLGYGASQSNMVRPLIEGSGDLEIKKGRHPLVEHYLPSGTYVPSNLTMNTSTDRFLLITGPNMAGKSTVIRQAGVVVLMAQVGAYVPAESARIGLVDQIFTRVGASDRLARGESTFMVEMSETASILHQATSQSLVLLDEIGRGTSTFDGISIAWAVAEYLHDELGARTLFATHYHELMDLASLKEGIKNYNVEVREDGEHIVFLYRLIPGGMSRSFGLHVAKLAGLPKSIIERAKEILGNLEHDDLEPNGKPRIARKRSQGETVKDEKEKPQISLF